MVGIYYYNKAYNNMKYKITESQFKKLVETAKIRPFTDADYDNVNPTQNKDTDFGKIKNLDDAYKAKTGQKRDSTEQWRQASGPMAKRLKDLQARLTNVLQDRYMGKMGTNKPIIPPDKLGKIGNKQLAKTLGKYGMEVEIKGKTFSYGNTKVPENTLVVNLTTAFNCPSKNGDCQWGKRCYAHQTEVQYKDTEYRNLRNQHTLGMLSVKELLELVEAYIESAPNRIKFIRIHEDGDFQDQETLEFCDKLAGHLNAKYGIQTTAYTHRVLDYSNINNMTINASSYKIKSGDRYFVVVSEEDWNKIPEGLDFSGKDIPMQSIENGQKIDTTHGTYRCPCDCRNCMFCYRTKAQNGEPENNMISVIETIH